MKESLKRDQLLPVFRMLIVQTRISIDDTSASGFSFRVHLNIWLPAKGLLIFVEPEIFMICFKHFSSNKSQYYFMRSWFLLATIFGHSFGYFCKSELWGVDNSTTELKGPGSNPALLKSKSSGKTSLLLSLICFFKELAWTKLFSHRMS